MDKMEALLKDWKEMTHSMEMELLAKDELIDALEGQIRCLREQVTILEDEKKKLINAGNMFSDQCEKLEKLCTSQQELIEEFRAFFSDMPEKL